LAKEKAQRWKRTPNLVEKPHKSTVSSDQCELRSGVVNSCVILKFLMEMTIKTALRDVTVCSFADGYRRFEATCWRHYYPNDGNERNYVPNTHGVTLRRHRQSSHSPMSELRT
jgi:hypothetical protein